MRGAVVLAATVAQERHQLAGRRVERAMHDATGVASREAHDLLLAAPGPGRPQRRELAQRRLVAEPHLPTGRGHGCRLLNDAFFALRRRGLARPAPTLDPFPAPPTRAACGGLSRRPPGSPPLPISGANKAP